MNAKDGGALQQRATTQGYPLVSRRLAFAGGGTLGRSLDTVSRISAARAETPVWPKNRHDGRSAGTRGDRDEPSYQCRLLNAEP
jgi:hypothetical protein